MKILKEIFGRVWALWGLLLFIATMLPAFVFYLPCAVMSEPKRTVWFRHVSRLWMFVYLHLIGCPIRIRGKAVFQTNENYIVVCNHSSLIDVPVTTPFLPHPNKTIAKSSFARVPLFGWIYGWGSILVNRKDPKSRANSYVQMIQVLNEWHLDMVLYPEGTRNKSEKPLGKFQDGAFKLATQTNKKIIPAILFNSKKVLPAAKPFFLNPSVLELHVLPPHSPEGKTAQELRETIYREMWQYIVENTGDVKSADLG
ncbi:MAG: lysophospholipid acyltransferase family protein [Chitinophagaceae bacterium]